VKGVEKVVGHSRLSQNSSKSRKGMRFAAGVWVGTRKMGGARFTEDGNGGKGEGIDD